MPGIVIAGAGFGGIGMGIALKKAGDNDFVILDKARRVAVIGTGMSAIQFVPEAAEQAA